MKKEISIKAALRMALEVFKGNWMFVVGAIIIVLTMSVLIDFIINEFSGAIFVIANLLSLVPQVLIGMGFLYIMLEVYDKKDVKYTDWFKPIGMFLNYFVVMILTTIIVLVGLVLFIVPGIIAIITLMFAPYLVIDKGMGAIDAMKKSWNMSKGYRCKLFLSVIVMTI